MIYPAQFIVYKITLMLIRMFNNFQLNKEILFLILSYLETVISFYLNELAGEF